MKQKLMTIFATITLMVNLVAAPVSAAYAATLDEAIDGATAKMLSDGAISSDWEALAVARSNTPASKELRQDYYNQIVTYLNTTDRLSATDYERTIIGVVSVGGDPTNIPEANEHKNLVEELYRMNVINNGTNAIIYGLLALQTKEYDVPADAVFSIEELVVKLVSLQKSDGGWALFGSASDIDITGMAMSALAKYQDLPGVMDAIDDSINYLSTVQLDSGGFKGWSNENSNSIAQAIMGITMTENDPTDPRFTKSHNAIEALMTYRVDDGGFKWLLTDTGSNGMALEQASYALAQYKMYDQGAEFISIYDFVNNPVPQLVDVPIVPDPDPDPNPNPNPDPMPDPDPIPDPKPDPTPTPDPKPIPNPDPDPNPNPVISEKPVITEPTVVKETNKSDSDNGNQTNYPKVAVSESKVFPKTGETNEFGTAITLIGFSAVLVGLFPWYGMKKKKINQV
ncbi:prenyltransferase/squalene oxidase repeat-containing protein [Carnobacterium gallinarum]|uniref:prenyltransferase/squalene oxidase repeat-containing protein n=1 Tax=Carnobacterium gallinarum TaxID=2749 RepID=UPI001FDF496B|nr:prenyltransferase/squalene oxidase repeat-containing protein [Carnobacterium gallinarum]